MSGGSLDYAYQRVRDLADAIERHADRPEHRAFAAHLHKVAAAAKALEWVWSGDCGPGDEIELIRAILDPNELALAELKQVTEAAGVLLDTLARLQHSGHFVVVPE